MPYLLVKLQSRKKIRKRSWKCEHLIYCLQQLLSRIISPLLSEMLNLHHHWVRHLGRHFYFISRIFNWDYNDSAHLLYAVSPPVFKLNCLSWYDILVMFTFYYHYTSVIILPSVLLHPCRSSSVSVRMKQDWSQNIHRARTNPSCILESVNSRWNWTSYIILKSSHVCTWKIHY
jgi:hypothetical protein